MCRISRSKPVLQGSRISIRQQVSGRTAQHVRVHRAQSSALPGVAHQVTPSLARHRATLAAQKGVRQAIVPAAQIGIHRPELVVGERLDAYRDFLQTVPRGARSGRIILIP